ncbi:hypothetical protein GALMADRAFT_76073 [Galerina marginata CBS 339.88]|uniref:Arabinogalactan endo-beta-1,4-galactanase n=1 Tax=Galerina marginata (strain CBS 339.88) TaxID=685588 RepID=A0A067SHI2_GALM3|nr:hypothetical protein GALMADRAFT_76073 [Galerina marginata CBS 339.88]
MRFIVPFILSVASYVPVIQALRYRGADFSSLINLENSGHVYSDSKSAPGAKFETILHNHGANLARIRIWTSTNDANYSLQYGLALGKRAFAAGLELYIDLHYSDTWADPSHQAIPSGWPKDLPSLSAQVFNYTTNVVKSFSSQGTPIKFIEIGNEINSGMLWPTGQTSTANGFSPLSQLLHSAASAVRAAAPATKVMIHLANGWNLTAVSNFYSRVFIPGQLSPNDIDVMGFSIYPFRESAATLSALESSLQNITLTYEKDIMVVETDWPFDCPGVTLSESSIPVSTAGQSTWMTDIKNILAGLPGGHGLGIAYWEPGWLGSASLGSGCVDNLLVDSTGKTRSSISMFSSFM